MAVGPVFPGFIKIEYKQDGSSKAKFLADAAQLSGEVKKPFSEAFDQIGKMVDRVSGKLKNGQFAIDLDVSGLRVASAQADFTMKKVQALRDAAIQMATSSRDGSESTKAFVTALQAQAAQAEKNAQIARDQVTAYSNLQGAVSGLTQGNKGLADSYRVLMAEQSRAASTSNAAKYQAEALKVQEQQRNELLRMRAAADQLRASLDPAVAVQQRYSSELERVGQLLKARVIDQDLYTKAIERASQTRQKELAGIAKSGASTETVPEKSQPSIKYGVDALLAGQGSAGSAVMSIISMETALGRVQKKGKEVAGALAEVERAAADAAKERVAAEMAAAAASDKLKADAANEMQRLAQSADILRAQLDPAIAAQNRFNAALDRADELLKAGAIDQRTYGQAVAKAQGDLQESWRSLTVAQEQQQRVAKQGTTADQNVINSLRSVRVAGIQAGQQFQDMAVQFQSGTKASIIMAQQLPQLAFALSGLEGNTNKTLDKVGKFSTFLAGPWGAAILIAGVVLAPFIEKLFDAGKASDEAAKKAKEAARAHETLADKLNITKHSYEEIILATREYNAEQRIANQLTLEGAQAAAIQAAKNLDAAVAIRKKLAAELDASIKNTGPGFSTGGRAANFGGVYADGPEQTAAISATRQRMAENEKAISSLGMTAKNTVGSVASEMARLNTDPQYAIEQKFKKLSREAVAAGGNVNSLTKKLTALNIQKKAEQDALKPAKVGSDPAKQAERAAKAAQRLGEFSEDAGKKIANIRDSFRDIPPEVERVNKASRELDDIISDLMNRKPEGFKELIDQAESLKTALPDMSFGRVMRQITEDAQQQVAVQSLILQGREGEADALRQIYQIEQQLGPLRADQKQDIIDTSVAMQRVNEAMQRAQEIQSVFLDSTRAVRGEVEAILGGYGKLSDLGATLKRSFQQIQGKVLTEQIFGDLFRDMDRYVKDKTGIGSSVDMMAKETVRAGEAAGTLADEMIAAAQRIAGAGSSATSAAAIGSSAISGGWSNIGIPPLLKAPANENYDPNAPIVVEAKKPGGTRTVNDLRPEEYFHKFGQAFGGKFAAILEPLLGKKLAGNLGGVLGGVLEGQATTGTGFGAILGGLKELKGLPEGLTKGLGKAFSGAQTGAAVAGIGNALGLKMSNEGAQIGGALGSFLGPAGSIIGALGGGFLGKLFGGTKKGYAVASNGSVSTGGNSKQAEAAGTSASALNESLGSIAKAFGSSLGNYAVSIGSRSSGYISVSASGSSSVADKGYKKGQIGKDIIYDGKDMEEALRVALQNAIQDGAIAGIKAGSKRLLSLGSNIDAQVEKALKFEGVFKSLRAIKDPMGAALDELNTEFKNLIDIFKEAGASTTEFGQLEELYGIQRKEAIEQVTQAMTSSLKALKEELTIGSDYFSLRDRKASALDVYNPLKDRVAAGDTTAFDAFSDAARNLISIEREISGSTSPFFALLKEVTNLSDNALNGQTASISATTASDSPFAALAAQNAATASAIDNQTDALLAGIGGRLDLMNANLIAALRGQTTQATQATFDVSQFYANKRFW